MAAENNVTPHARGQSEQRQEEMEDFTSVPTITLEDEAPFLDQRTQCTAVVQVTRATQYSDPDSGNETSLESSRSSLRPIYVAEGSRRRRLVRHARMKVWRFAEEGVVVGGRRGTGTAESAQPRRGNGRLRENGHFPAQ